MFLIGTIVIVGIVILDVLYHISNSQGSLGKKGSRAIELQQDFQRCDELLHARLWQLQDMDQQFASLVSNQNDHASLTKTNASIQLAEENFRRSLDSISRVGASYDEKSHTNDFENMITFFKKILENRRFIAFTRMSIISGSGGSTSQTIMKLQNEIYEKDRQIASSSSNKTVLTLQGQLAEKEKQIMLLEAQAQKDQAEKQTYVQNAQRLQTEIAEKDKVIASLGSKKAGGDQKALVDLQAQLSAKNNQINTLQTQLQTEKQSYTQTVQKLQGEIAEKDRALATASKKLPNDQKTVSNLQNEIATRNKQISDLQSQAQTDKKSYTQTIQKYQADLAQKTKMVDALSNIKIPTDDKAVASLQRELSSKNKQISDLQAEVDAKNRLIASNSGKQVSTDQKAFAAIQTELATKNGQIDNLQKTINDLQAELIEKNKLIAQAGNRRVPTDQKAVVTLQNEIAEKDKRIRRLEEQLQTGVASSRPAGGAIVKDLEQTNTNLRLAYNNTMTQLGVLQKKYNVLKAEMDQMKGQQ